MPIAWLYVYSHFLFACSKQLDHRCKEREGELYCLRCYDNMVSAICGACRFVYLLYPYHWGYIPNIAHPQETYRRPSYPCSQQDLASWGIYWDKILYIVDYFLPTGIMFYTWLKKFTKVYYNKKIPAIIINPIPSHQWMNLVSFSRQHFVFSLREAVWRSQTLREEGPGLLREGLQGCTFLLSQCYLVLKAVCLILIAERVSVRQLLRVVFSLYACTYVSVTLKNVN